MSEKISPMPEQNKIERLEESVVNRIAAGEVIQRPANALKELLENSLDAKSSSISVVVQKGGLKLLQITDNGTGIRKEDMVIVCERFTTSKLRKFEDLGNIATFGFRGEALASISHVARLSIVTKIRDEVCGYRGCYSDGKLEGKLNPCAANQGTQITVEDLFFNIPTRKKALKSPSDEFHRVADVISKYAIHNSGVSFTLKKQGDQTCYVRTQKNASVVDNIRVIYGNEIAKELIPVQEENVELKFKVNGQITNVNYNTNKFTFLLFINHRLVDCTPLKKGVEMIFEYYMPKHKHPFVYLSLEIDPQNVDVNVHPTKHEVFFLNQDEIIECIQNYIDKTLKNTDRSRAFYTHTRIPEVLLNPLETIKYSKEESNKVPEKSFVRTDAKEQKMDKFINTSTKIVNETKSEEEIVIDDSVKTDTETKIIDTSRKRSHPQTDPFVETLEIDEENEIKEDQELVNKRVIKLSSIRELRNEIVENTHEEIKEIVVNHFFVGCIDRSTALIQYNVRLFIVNTTKLSEELFYQRLLKDFGNFNALKLTPSASIKELALIALDSKEADWTEADGPKDELADKVVNILKEKSEMLDDYFSIQIDDEGNLVTLPEVIRDYVPDLNDLAFFIIRLATEVNWSDEKECFRSFCRQVALFYSIKDIFQTNSNEDNENESVWKKAIEHFIFDECKKDFNPPSSFVDNLVLGQTAYLPDLYKVFERC